MEDLRMAFRSIVLNREAEEEYEWSVSSSSILWNKENLLNLVMDRLDASRIGYIVWCDADIFFTDPESFRDDVLRALQTYTVIQCFSVAVDMGPDGCTPIKTYTGAISSYANKIPKISSSSFGTDHTGYVWASRLDFLRHVGGLFEYAVIGGADRIMAHAFMGIPIPNAHIYGAVLEEWVGRVRKHISSVGFLDRVVRHGYHGKKKNRGYGRRSRLLMDTVFHAEKHVTKNAEGVLEWTETAPQELIHGLITYFHSREEDDAPPMNVA